MMSRTIRHAAHHQRANNAVANNAAQPSFAVDWHLLIALYQPRDHC